MWPWQQNQNKWSRLGIVGIAILCNVALLFCIARLIQAERKEKELAPTLLSVYWSERPRKQELREEISPPPPNVKPRAVAPLPRVVTRVPFRIPSFASEISLSKAQFRADAPQVSVVVSAMRFTPRPMQAQRQVVQTSTVSTVAIARPTFRTPPQYPIKARQQGIEGSVTMLLLVGTDGRIQDVKVREETPEGIFRTSALRAVKRWRFRAPNKPTWQRLTIAYQLEK